mgnify:CR=1 FL=1
MDGACVFAVSAGPLWRSGVIGGVEVGVLTEAMVLGVGCALRLVWGD